MQLKTLGNTGLNVSRIAFGCGPLSGNLTGTDFSNQLDSVRRAIELGINWFDTARTYGAGRSEENLGCCFAELGIRNQAAVATKVRVLGEELVDISGAVRRSVNGSLEALQREQLELVQIHNAITVQRGSQPTSLTPADVLGQGGVLETLESLRSEGVIQHIGITGTGDSVAVAEVLDSRRVETVQVPFSASNISAGYQVPEDQGPYHYGTVMKYREMSGVGVFAIRVFAGGALLLRNPSPHTFTTKFFPLELYDRDLKIAGRLATIFPETPLAELCTRFVLSHALVDSAIIGFANQQQVEQAVAAMELGDLLSAEMRLIEDNASAVLE